MSDPTLDDVISEYIGKVTSDKAHIASFRPNAATTLEFWQRKLRKDEIALGALRCAKAHGYTGEV